MDDIFQIKDIDHKSIMNLYSMLNLCGFYDNKNYEYIERINNINPDNLNAYNEFIEIYYDLLLNVPDSFDLGFDNRLKTINKKLDKVMKNEKL